MQYNINDFINKLCEQRKTVLLRLKTLDSEMKNDHQELVQKNKRLSTIDLPTMSMQFLELDITQQQEKKETMKVNKNKKLIMANRKRSLSINSNKKSSQFNYILPKIDPQKRVDNPLPIFFPKQEKFIKQRKVSNYYIDYFVY